MPPEHSGKPEVQEAFVLFFGRLHNKELFFDIDGSPAAKFIVDLAVVAVADPADLAALEGGFDSTVRLVDMNAAVKSAVRFPFFKFRIIIMEAVRFNILDPQRSESGRIDHPGIPEFLIRTCGKQLHMTGGVFAAADFSG